MKFGMGSNAERTQKYGGSKYKMTYIRPNINKQTSPIFNCVTPVSVSLATLACRIYIANSLVNAEFVASSCNQVNSKTVKRMLYIFMKDPRV